MEEVTIRPYDPADLKACRLLWVELTQRHREIYGDPTIGGEAPGLHFDEHLARVGPGRLWVAVCGGQVVGLTGLIIEGREAEMEPIVVTAARRSSGIGRALVERVMAEARQLGVRYLSVRPVARNVEAISFLHRAGFQTLGHIDMFLELQTGTPHLWKPGPELLGRTFQY